MSGALRIKYVKIKEEKGKKVIKETEAQEIDIPLVRVGYKTKKCKCVDCKLVKAGTSPSFSTLLNSIANK